MKKILLIYMMTALMVLLCSGCKKAAETDAETGSRTESTETASSGEAESEKQTTEADPQESELDSSTEEATEPDSTVEEITEPEESPESSETEIEWETDETITGETNESGIIDGQPMSTEQDTPPQTQPAAGEIVSSMPYLIKVNRQANCVTVYAKGDDGRYSVPVKSMICSCARSGFQTPLGTFQITDHYVWRELFGHVYGYYSTRIVGTILFHSVPYVSPNPATLEMEEYDKLGQNASQGCIRLQVKDSKWIYENCAAGTYVIIYDSPDPGPLGRPEAMKVSGIKGKLYGWDPTDVTPGNPWLSCTSTLTVSTTSVSLKVGDSVDLKKYASACDLYGNPVEISIDGSVNTKKAGKYNVTYSITDVYGKTESMVITFTVSKKSDKDNDDKETKPDSDKETTKKETTKHTEKETTEKETTVKETTEKETTEKETTVENTTEKETTVKETTSTEAETTVKETTRPPETTVTEPETTEPSQPSVTETQPQESSQETATSSSETTSNTEENTSSEDGSLRASDGQAEHEALESEAEPEA